MTAHRARLLAVLVTLLALLHTPAAGHASAASRTHAPIAAAVQAPAPAQAPGAAQGQPPSTPTTKSLLQHIRSGGIIGYIIIALSLVMVALTVMHLVQVRRQSLAPPATLAALDQLLSSGDITSAVAMCRKPENDSMVTRVLDAALTRCSRSSFGLLELRTATEEAGQAEIAKLYRSIDGIGWIASVAPMLGLLGTVVGMVGAFETIAVTEGFAKPADLASNIAVALITTVLGLIVAIPATLIHAGFRNRVDTLAGEVGDALDELIAHLDARPGAARQTTPAARASAPVPGVARPAQQGPPRPQAAPVAARAPSAPPAPGATP